MSDSLSLQFDGLEEAMSEKKYIIGHRSVAHTFSLKRFIDYGYRSRHSSFYDVFLSLFSLHNETTNIWSHLIGCICCFIAGINCITDLWFHSKDSLEISAFLSFIICACFCLLSSCVYHWFGCLSESCHKSLLALDQFGVGLLVASSFLPGVYYGFYCSPTAQVFHFVLTGIVLISKIQLITSST